MQQIESKVKQVGDKQVLVTKVDKFWELLEYYLATFTDKWCFFEDDEEFMKLYNALYAYVCSKTILPSGGDIITSYTVYVQEVE